jgi:hypothetical protein
MTAVLDRHPRATRLRSLCLSVLVATAAALGATAVDPPRVAACSCAVLESIVQYADAKSVIVAGSATGVDASGVRFAVGEWFWGANPQPVVWLAPSSFGDSAACGIGSPAAGTRWLYVGYRDRPTDALNVNLCSPHVDLATPEGQAALAEARRAFAAIARPPEPSDGQAPTTTPAATGAAENARTQALLVIGAAIVGVVIVLFGGLAFAARRRSRAGS